MNPNDDFLQYVGGYALEDENTEELTATSVDPLSRMKYHT